MPRLARRIALVTQGARLTVPVCIEGLGRRPSCHCRLPWQLIYPSSAVQPLRGHARRILPVPCGRCYPARQKNHVLQSALAVERPRRIARGMPRCHRTRCWPARKMRLVPQLVSSRTSRTNLHYSPHRVARGRTAPPSTVVVGYAAHRSPQRRYPPPRRRNPPFPCQIVQGRTMQVRHDLQPALQRLCQGDTG